jgi:hypothetical protein
MRFLKQSTAATLVLGPFVSSTDGVTADTALTVAQADVRLTKNGGTFAQKNDATSATHMENGNYSVPINTTDTNTLGALRVFCTKTACLPVWHDFIVLPPNTYEALVGGTEYLEVTGLRPTFSVSGGTLTVKKPDGATTQYTKTVTTDGTAQPIIGAS